MNKDNANEIEQVILPSINYDKLSTQLLLDIIKKGHGIK